MEIETLSILQRVAALGSFAAVARERHVDPSSISRLVAQSEAELGLRLFHRSTRSLRPTAEGAAYLARIAPLLEGLEEAAEEARTGRAAPRGTVRLGCSVALGTLRIAPLLAEFNAQFPAISLEVLMDDEPSDLISSGLDIALRLAPQVEGDLICSRLAPTRYHVCATPDWSARLPSPAALAETPVLRQSIAGYREAWHIRARDGEVENVAVHGPHVLSSPLAILAAAEAGAGPALLADWVSARAVEEGRLIRLWPDYAVTATTFDTALWLIYPSRTHLPARVRATIDFFRSVLGRNTPL